MTRVHIVTDADGQMDRDLARRLDITVVPLTVRVGKEVYQDEEGERNEELLMRMALERIRPEIVGPTVDDFRAAYTRLTRLTDQIVSVHSSARLSNIVRNARAAAADFLGRCDIMVMDSQTTSLGLTILAREAAKMAQAGGSWEEILRRIRGMIPRIYVVMITETLDYLERSARISPAQCILGTMLGLKPSLAIENGEIIPMEKVRSWDKGLDKLIEFAGEFPSVEEIAILQSSSLPPDGTLALKERLQAFFPGMTFPVLSYGPLLASHVGPEGLGLVAFEGLEDGAY
ncbi:MAG: DegV family protein [Anaerolineae bacterium]